LVSVSVGWLFWIVLKMTNMEGRNGYVNAIAATLMLLKTATFGTECHPVVDASGENTLAVLGKRWLEKQVRDGKADQILRGPNVHERYWHRISQVFAKDKVNPTLDAPQLLTSLFRLSLTIASCAV